MNFKALEDRIPQGDPDIQIGELFIWIGDYLFQEDNPDYSLFYAPMLLRSSTTIAYSAGSQLQICDLNNLKSAIQALYDKVGVEATFKVVFQESEFGVVFVSDIAGKITVTILYYAWSHDGTLHFDSTIDQSYLPGIMRQIDSVLNKAGI